MINYFRQLMSTGRSLGLGTGAGETLRDINTMQAMKDRERRFAADQMKFTLNKFNDLYKTASPASKKVIAEQMGSLANLMSPTELTAAKMILAHSPINEMAQKGRWFDEMYPKTEFPKDAEGNPLPEIPENYRQIAAFRFGEEERIVRRAMVMHGEGVGEKMAKVPTFIQVGDKIAYKDPQTQGIMIGEQSLILGDVKEAEQLGWTVPRMMNENFRPTGPSKTMIEGGISVLIQPGKDLVTGEDRINKEYLGRPDAAIKDVPGDLRDAFAHYELDTDTDDIKNASVRIIVEKLKDLPIRYGGREPTKEEKKKGISKADIAVANAEKTVNELNDLLQNRYPNSNFKVFFNLTPETVVSSWWPGTEIKIKDGAIVLAAADRVISLVDANGAVGKFHQDSATKIVRDNQGTPIKTATGAGDGDQVPDITLKQPTEWEFAKGRLKVASKQIVKDSAIVGGLFKSAMDKIGELLIAAGESDFTAALKKEAVLERIRSILTPEEIDALEEGGVKGIKK